MIEKPTYEDLEQRIALLENKAGQWKRFEAINSTLFKISNAINTTSSLDELFKNIHLILSPIIDTTNFYIALYDRIQDSVTFSYFADTVDEFYPTIFEISKSASLTAEVIRTKVPLMMNKAEMLAHWTTSSFIRPACTPAAIWLGVPLKIRGEIIGVMAVQNYHVPLSYDQTDMKVLVSVSDQMARAIDRKQADESLRQSEERFRKLLQDIPSVAVQGYRSDGTTQYWNHASELLYGYTAQEAIGKNLLNLIIPAEMQEDVEQAMRQMAETGQAIPASELSLKHKDGSRVTVFSSHAIVEIPGRPKELFCIDIDLTENKRSKDTIQTNAAHLQSIFRAAPVGIGVVVNRVLKQVNERLCEMTGYTQFELLEQRADMLYVDKASSDYVGREKYRQIKMYGTGTVETKWRQKSGNIIVVLLSSTPFDTADLAKGVTFTATDITEQKRAEVTIRESERKYRLLFETANDGILLLEPTKIIDCNKRIEAMYGVTKNDIIGLSPLAFSPERQPNGQLSSRIAAIATQAAFKGKPQIFEWQCIRPDGVLFDTELTLNRVEMDGSYLLQGMVRDITEQKKAEEEREKLQAQLIQAQKMESVGRLAGGVAHDFNNMLGVIIGHTEMALDHMHTVQPFYDNLQEILKAANRSADLTRQLLAFARKQTINPRIIDLNKTVEGMLKMLKRLIGEDIELTWMPGNDVKPVKMDPSQIDQILANLCVNARDAINGVGKLTIATELTVIDEAHCAAHLGFIPGEYVLLTVSDDGCGMNKEVMAKLFEPFFTTKEFDKGTGLGLATIYGIVKQNNGFVDVYSELGKGTTFKIYLPQDKGEPQRIIAEALVNMTAQNTETILLVEDEPATLKMTTLMLEKLGYSVLAASTPDKALKIAEKSTNRIDLLVTDIIMPGMNGQVLAETLLYQVPNLKQLFMSGYTSDVISLHIALREGINFIQKPFSLNVLAAKVRVALETHETA